jgi:hypothetical protein
MNMARWSDVMKLSEYRQFHFFLDNQPGCYRIGTYRSESFTPKYIGRASNLWTRIPTYMDPGKCHNAHLLMRLFNERHTLWFQVIRTPRFHGLEARQQATYGVGADGLFEWNQRTEWTFINH